MPPRKPKTLDIDAVLAKEYGDVDLETIPTFKVMLFGEEFTFYKDVNVFNILSVEDNPGQIATFLLNMVKGDDKPRLKRTLGMQRGLTAERLIEIFNQLVEAATDGEVPTKRPSGSSRGRGTGAAALESGAD